MAELTAHELVHRLRIESPMRRKAGADMNMSASACTRSFDNDVSPVEISRLGATFTPDPTARMLRSGQYRRVNEGGGARAGQDVEGPAFRPPVPWGLL